MRATLKLPASPLGLDVWDDYDDNNDDDDEDDDNDNDDDDDDDDDDDADDDDADHDDCVKASLSDSLSSIAARHKTTTSELVHINRLMTNMIFPGQVNTQHLLSSSYHHWPVDKRIERCNSGCIAIRQLGIKA